MTVSQNPYLNNPSLFVGVTYDLLVWYDPTGVLGDLYRPSPVWATPSAVKIEGWTVLLTDLSWEEAETYRRQLYAGILSLDDVLAEAVAGW